MAADLARRSGRTEWMDTEEIGATEFEACLRDLARVNALTLAYRPTLSWFARAVERRDPGRALHVLDVGCGYGDMLRRLLLWSRERGIDLDCVGIDLNPWAKPAAQAATPPGWPIRYRTADIFAYKPDRPVDIIISSLFTHHLTDEELIKFLRWMDAQAGVGWFINDLHRHWLPYHSVRLAFPLLRFHRMVVHDGPISVARGFTPADWDRLLQAAGLRRPDVQVERFFPFRFGVGCLRQGR